MEAWLANPQLLSADADAEYAAVIEIDLADVHEPIVCLPERSGRREDLSDVAGAARSTRCSSVRA
jgi:aconitate hydratase 2/2-methylisocitrate dehydratase